MRMKQQGEYASDKYARELRKWFEDIDPEAMKDVEGYWSHLLEDYETGLQLFVSNNLKSIPMYSLPIHHSETK